MQIEFAPFPWTDAKGRYEFGALALNREVAMLAITTLFLLLSGYNGSLSRQVRLAQNGAPEIETPYRLFLESGTLRPLKVI